MTPLQEERKKKHSYHPSTHPHNGSYLTIQFSIMFCAQGAIQPLVAAFVACDNDNGFDKIQIQNSQDTMTLWEKYVKSIASFWVRLPSLTNFLWAQNSGRQLTALKAGLVPAEASGYFLLCSIDGPAKWHIIMLDGGSHDSKVLAM